MEGRNKKKGVDFPQKSNRGSERERRREREVSVISSTIISISVLVRKYGRVKPL